MSNTMRTLKFESLEQKQMLAGDVTVSVVEGVLTLQGDELDNQVVVSSGEEAGTYVIRGLEETQIVLGDAEPAAEVVVEGVRALAARMGEGNDVLRIQNAAFRGNVNVGMGAGDDRVVVGLRPEVTPAAVVDLDANVKLGRNLTIHTDGGNDTALIASTYGRGALNVSTGEGNDIVRIGRPEPTTPEDGETLAASVDAEADVSFRLGVRVALGEGDDTLGVNSLRAGALHVNGGAGADHMRIAGVRSHAIGVMGGEGDDEVAIRESATRLLFAELGAGDDTLSLGGVKAQLALLLGGPGESDTLTLLGDNMIRHRLIRGFETINRPGDAPMSARRR